MPKANAAKAKRQVNPLGTLTLMTTDTEAGVSWLHSLGEEEFRDTILEHLFRKMLKASEVEWYANIHGRNDKGVDYLVVERTSLGRRIQGIQVKSKEIKRSEASGALSSIRIKQECEAAMTHEFDVQGQKSRLDNIAVWCSAHVTEDAEKEFLAPGSLIRVGLFKEKEIFRLLERHCPETLRKVPQCALTHYLNEKANPKPTNFRLLGKALNPRTNFLVPKFAKHGFNSHERLKMKNSVISANEPKIVVQDIIASDKHIVIQAPELSGKSYLLEHLQCLSASKGEVPLLLANDIFENRNFRILNIVSKAMGFLNVKEVEELVQNVRITLFIDNIDSMHHEIRSSLFALNPKEFKVVGSARDVTTPEAVEDFYMVGVNTTSIPEFLRSLDKTDTSISFTDRAHSFITRSLASSGLPDNPFTIAVLLEECQLSSEKFSTPTMGRLIERFIELQLGSHSEFTAKVDFETKREFLTKLGGGRELTLTIEQFRRKLSTKIESRAHPHKLEDFFQDLINSGVFKISHDGLHIGWSHPVIKEYFWVRNLIANRKFEPIVRRLCKSPNMTLAALAGSQLQNARPLIKPLLTELEHLKLPTDRQVLKSVQQIASDLFPSEEEEEKMLNDIETNSLEGAFGRDGQEDTGKTADDGLNLSSDQKKHVLKNIEPLLMQMVNAKFHVTHNLSALLVNSRDTKIEEKAESVNKILIANQRLAELFHKLCSVLFEETFKGRTKVDFKSTWLRIYFQLTFTDSLLGDPHLVNVFQKCLTNASTDDDIITLLDLLLCCGSTEYETILKNLKTINRIEVTFAFYIRLVSFYFYRYHREREKQGLRKLMKDMRKLHKALNLPTVAS